MFCALPRIQVTLWGPEKEGLHHYAYKLWNGLVGRFYLGRWQRWFAALKAGQPTQSLNVTLFQEQIVEWEEDWTRAQDAASYPTEQQGDAVALAKGLQALLL